MLRTFRMGSVAVIKGCTVCELSRVVVGFCSEVVNTTTLAFFLDSASVVTTKVDGFDALFVVDGRCDSVVVN